jgi:DNA-binding NarL/FixJ family response regulator
MEKNSSESPYRIILADDHVLVREGIKRILREKGDLQVVGEAGDGLELLRLIDTLILNESCPHLVILDIAMPHLLGIAATRRIKKVHPEIKVLILSMHKDKEYLSHAFSAGAEGYLVKADADTELFSAIETIRQGGVYVSPLIQEMGCFEGRGGT